ncbi:glycoside hydrolase family 68 protein [Sphingobium sp.]|uniref:glycoside hydrolase family 68 protein n=1 Tax=Sphingobium sp. TaxID=1912891 RepID=UPI0028BE732E|nr:glycoside hydrolase family 68 protein [Sphingobium sp.]
MTTSWTATHVAAIPADPPAIAPITERHLAQASADLGLWDAWPVQMRDGTPILLKGGAELWMALAAPRFSDPDMRHGQARIHLFRHQGGRWIPLGPAMPDGFSPGSREWSGSALLDESSGDVILYFTAAGRRGEGVPTFEQRMFSARARLTDEGKLVDWDDLREVIPPNPSLYMPTTAGGAIGTIKAFRDPAYFRDPADGRHHLFFAGSLAGSSSAFNGVVGIASAPADRPGEWTIGPPLISADGLNNELERPHVVHHDGRYYLFWSTQAHVFDPAGPIGPTGLYGMVADALAGPWRPLNGTGLVFANPAAAPAQSYSWMVLPDLSVTSFIDNWGGGQDRRFGGTFAPFVRLWIDGDAAGVVALDACAKRQG